MRIAKCLLGAWVLAGCISSGESSLERDSDAVGGRATVDSEVAGEGGRADSDAMPTAGDSGRDAFVHAGDAATATLDVGVSDVSRADATQADFGPPDAATPDASPPADGDGDGISDADDDCPAAPDPLQRDADRDGLGDACDAGDSDSDGLTDMDDPCPATAEPTSDTDGDSIGDACDVCPRDADSAQLDTDGDGIGDVCEIPGDDDADGVPDARDSCPHLSNGDQADFDMDGVGNECDLCPQDPDPDQQDSDGDGMGDGCDICPDVPLVAGNHLDRDLDGVPICGDDCDDTNPRRAAGLPEICDEVDNNCDGRVDEGFDDLGADCSSGRGACNVTGHVACQPNGAAACDALPLPAAAEVCDLLDNDCDGVADEELPDCCAPGTMAPCGTDVGACRRGQRTCDASGRWGECDGRQPVAEDCNDIDDDCDGQTDEDLGERVCGVGQCQHVIAACVEGAGPQCDALRGAGPESCDGIDNDCDGAVDNGFDFETDASNCGRCGHACGQDVRCEGGRCVGERMVVMLCGASERNISDFMRGRLAAPDVAVVNDCMPDQDTIALLVTGRGVLPAVANGWIDWVSNGGNIIASSANGAALLTAITGEPAVQGVQLGDCASPNLMPEVQLTPEDAFWAQNHFAAGQRTGCIFNPEHYPGIVPLGGFSVRAGSVSLAYRPWGQGRIWLPTNWQTAGASMTEDSCDLMAAMILWPTPVNRR